MKKAFSLLLAGTLASSLVCAENFTQSNVDKAQDIIAATTQAHGGDADITDTHTE